jgi:hypothetical protein
MAPKQRVTRSLIEVARPLKSIVGIGWCISDQCLGGGEYPVEGQGPGTNPFKRFAQELRIASRITKGKIKPNDEVSAISVCCVNGFVEPRNRCGSRRHIAQVLDLWVMPNSSVSNPNAVAPKSR